MRFVEVFSKTGSWTGDTQANGPTQVLYEDCRLLGFVITTVGGDGVDPVSFDCQLEFSTTNASGGTMAKGVRTEGTATLFFDEVFAATVDTTQLVFLSAGNSILCQESAPMLTGAWRMTVTPNTNDGDAATACTVTAIIL